MRTTITVSFDRELLARVDRLVTRLRLTRAEVIRRAVRAFCEDQGRRPGRPVGLAAGLRGSLAGARPDRSRDSAFRRLIEERRKPGGKLVAHETLLSRAREELEAQRARQKTRRAGRKR